MKPDDISPEDIEADFDWGTLDSRVSKAIREMDAALEQALAASRELSRWVQLLHGLTVFVGQVESGVAEVRHQLKVPPQARWSAPVPPTAPKADAVEVAEPWPLERADDNLEVDEEPPLTALEAQEAESGPEPFETAAVVEAEEPPHPAEEEPSEGAPLVAEANESIRLQIEASEANIDLMVVERALRETPGIADVDLLDYAGKRARVQVTFSGSERHEGVADAERLAANVRERLAKLTWDDNLSVSLTE